jgi:hypothetical protein
VGKEGYCDSMENSKPRKAVGGSSFERSVRDWRERRFHESALTTFYKDHHIIFQPTICLERVRERGRKENTHRYVHRGELTCGALEEPVKALCRVMVLLSRLPLARA